MRFDGFLSARSAPVLFVVALVALGVAAFAYDSGIGDPSVFGHTLDEIAVGSLISCTNGQFLQVQSGTIVCATPSGGGGGGGGDPTSGGAGRIMAVFERLDVGGTVTCPVDASSIDPGVVDTATCTCQSGYVTTPSLDATSTIYFCVTSS